MIRAAVIDVGTNSVKLTIADLTDRITTLYEDSRITRLGKGVDSAGALRPDAIQKTLDAITYYYNVALNHGASSIIAAGTSALRDASNGNDLLSAVDRTCGLRIEIIAGKREADLAFKAVAGDPMVVRPESSNVLVFDIGGGSTELVWGVGGIVVENTSLNIGALRLTERHIRTDPPTDEEFIAASRDASESLTTFLENREQIPDVCGVGGTASTFAAMVHSTKEVHGSKVDVKDLQKCIDQLRSMPLAERRTVPYLNPERADIIVAGGAILLALLAAARVSRYTVSLRGMRFGLLLELMESERTSS